MSWQEALERYPVILQMPVQWGMMDAFRHVNNVAYFRYFEDGRIAYFERSGVLQWMDREGIGPIMASTQCRFKAPLAWPDTIHIATRVQDLQEDRFRMEHLIYSEKLDRIVASGDALIVSYDYHANTKAPLPPAWREAFRALDPSLED